MPNVYGHRRCKSLVEVAEKNHKHTAEEVGAAAKGHTHTAEEVGAAAKDHSHTLEELGIIINAIEPEKPTEGMIWINIKKEGA